MRLCAETWYDRKHIKVSDAIMGTDNIMLNYHKTQLKLTFDMKTVLKIVVLSGFVVDNLLQ